MLISPRTSKLFLIGALVSILCAVFLLPNIALAQADFGFSYGNALGLASGDPRIIAVSIIRVALTFIGIIAIFYIMYAGFLWMTSEGDEAKIDKAKKTLKNTIIGLIIIMSAWAIVTFVLNKLNEGMFGGPGPGPGPPGPPGGGVGVLGECTVESVYPEPNQAEVPRNTSIIVTFKEEVDPTTICDDTNSNGSCDSGEFIQPEHVRIYKTNTGDSCEILPCTGNELEVNVATNDNKTYVFVPVNYLGSPSEYIWYTVYLSNDIAKISDGSGIFNTCRTDFLEWQFEVSNKLDLIPPQVEENGIFPQPDNEVDDIGTETPAVQATGRITVNSQPDVYAIATAENPPSKIGASEDATVNGTYVCGENGTITVSINGAISQSDVAGPIGVVTGDDITDNIASLGCGLTLVPDDGTFTAGNSWTTQVTAEVEADTLVIGSQTYIFGSDIILGAGINDTASNIAVALASHSDIAASVGSPLNSVNMVAKVAGAAGNNIVLASDFSNLAITAMSGGQDLQVTTTVKDKKDKARNAVVQVNFNEAINPLTVSGSASDVEDYIRVVNVDTGTYLSGKFMVSNQYKTVEFISDNLCGVNGCGEQIYCLPENSHLRVELVAAQLADCGADDCASKTPYNNCVSGRCQNSSSKNYPAAAMPLSGIADASMNSLDGNRDEDADGPITFYNENSPNPSDGDNYQWSFFINDQIDLVPPMIDLVDPIHNRQGISLTSPILINFDSLMMSSSLRTGDTVIFNGKDYVTHKLINIWNFTSQPLAYWVSKNDIDNSAPLDGEPDYTQVQLNHSLFADTTSYRAQVGSGVKDIYQNCFKPSSSATCTGAPSCCGETPTASDNCP